MFAAYQGVLSAPQGDKRPLRAHLAAEFRQTGQMPDLLANPVEMPAAAVHLWQWYLEIARGRRDGGLIGPAEMLCFQQLSGIKIAPWERAAIYLMDTAFLAREAPTDD